MLWEAYPLYNIICHNGGVAALVFCRTSRHCQMLQELQLWKITLSFLLLTRALYPFHFSYVLAMASWSSMPQLFTFWHQKSLRVPCFTCALSAHLIVAWRVEGKAQGFLLEATQRTDPRNLNLCLASCVFPAQGGAVWSVSVKDGAAEHDWQWLKLCCACGRHFQSRWKCCRSLVRGGYGVLLEILAEKGPCSLEGAAEVLGPLWSTE